MIDQEFMADRSAAARYGTSSGYAASLLALADSRQAARTTDSVPDDLEQISPVKLKPEERSPLFQRVLMLLYCPFRIEPRAPQSWSWILKITVAVASLFAACLCLRWPDADALAERLAGRAGRPPQRFRVTDFVAEPLVFATGGRAVSYVMPVALPARFELTVEVFARELDLPKVRVAGYALGQPQLEDSRTDSSTPRHYAESWHTVRLERVNDEVLLWVDGKSVTVAARAESSGRWLTFEPGPDRPAQFRNLVVQW
jgi:hypothetical protein